MSAPSIAAQLREMQAARADLASYWRNMRCVRRLRESEIAYRLAIFDAAIATLDGVRRSLEDKR
jgi:hypothetical protein